MYKAVDELIEVNLNARRVLLKSQIESSEFFVFFLQTRWNRQMERSRYSRWRKKRNVTRKRAKGAENRERFRGRRRDRINASFARRRALRESCGATGLR